MHRGPGLLLILALSHAAYAQPTVALRVEVDPVPALERLVSSSAPPTGEDGKGSLLIETFFNDVKSNPNVTVMARGVSSGALSKLGGPKDVRELRDSNQRLAEFAVYASAMYGVHALVSLDPAKGPGLSGLHLLQVRARVVRRDGKLEGREIVKSAQMQKISSDALLARFKALTGELVGELNLGALVPFVPAPPLLGPSPSPSPGLAGQSGEVGGSIPPGGPPSPPPLVQMGEPQPLKLVGNVSLGVGGAAIVAGILVFATSPRFRTDVDGFVLGADSALVVPAQNQQRAGVGLIIAGGVVAATGAILSIVGQQQPAPVRASVVPIAGGGASVVLGGNFQ